MNETTRYYKNNNNQFFAVSNENELAIMDLEDLIAQGLYIHEVSNTDPDWVDDLTTDEKLAIVNIYDPTLFDDALDAFHYDEESDVERPSLDDLLDYGYIDDLGALVQDMDYWAFDNLMSKLTSVFAFTVTGYSQGEEEQVVMPKAMINSFNDKEQAQKYVQTVIYDSYNRIDRVTNDTELIESITVVNAMDYPTDEQYADDLDKYMLDNFNAEPAQLQISYTIA